MVADKLELEVMPEMFEENTDEQGFYKVKNFVIHHDETEADAVQIKIPR